MNFNILFLVSIFDQLLLKIRASMINLHYPFYRSKNVSHEEEID